MIIFIDHQEQMMKANVVKNGVHEFQRFSADLKDAQNGYLNGFEEFIRNSYSSDDRERKYFLTKLIKKKLII